MVRHEYHFHFLRPHIARSSTDENNKNNSIVAIGKPFSSWIEKKQKKKTENENWNVKEIFHFHFRLSGASSVIYEYVNRTILKPICYFETCSENDVTVVGQYMSPDERTTSIKFFNSHPKKKKKKISAIPTIYSLPNIATEMKIYTFRIECLTIFSVTKRQQ